MALMQQDVDEVEELDPAILDRLPPDIRQRIEDGAIDQLPEDVVERLPPSLQARIPDDLIAAAGDNPTLTAILIIAGVLGVVGFVYGVAKSAFKAAGFFGVVAAIAWIWFANR